MTRRTTPPPDRIFTHADRQRLDRAAEHYLRVCYKNKTAARASEFAAFLNVTPPYLSRIVPRIVGKTVHDFLRAKQIAVCRATAASHPADGRGYCATVRLRDRLDLLSVVP
jgi:hypothetical protein